MKKFYLVTVLLVLSLVIAACGQNDDPGNLDNNSGVTPNNGVQDNNTGTQNNDNNMTNNDVVDDTNNDVVDDTNTNQTETPVDNTDDQVGKMESLEYINFELDVKYNNDQDYEADLELENNRVDAKVEDDLNGVEIGGDGAFDLIYPLVEQLTIDQNTPKEDVISQILDVFDLPTDYEEFDLEIKFKDGTEIEYDDR